MNAAIDRRPKDLTVALHLCRGNVKGVAVAEAGYEPVADTLFNELNVDAYFLEFDDPRSEDFVPLRFVPKNKTVVLGLGSSKVAAPDSAEQIVERIKAAAKYMPLENLCLSPQCGFASTMHGNELTDAEQWARVGMIVKITEEVWGEAAV
jgi:5-methyltetrahydropteroyltriglutamate--homocysteine methyltransferase